MTKLKGPTIIPSWKNFGYKKNFSPQKKFFKNPRIFTCFSKKFFFDLQLKKNNKCWKHQKCFLNYKFARKRRKKFSGCCEHAKCLSQKSWGGGVKIGGFYPPPPPPPRELTCVLSRFVKECINKYFCSLIGYFVVLV